MATVRGLDDPRPPFLDAKRLLDAFEGVGSPSMQEKFIAYWRTKALQCEGVEVDNKLAVITHGIMMGTTEASIVAGRKKKVAALNTTEYELENSVVESALLSRLSSLLVTGGDTRCEIKPNTGNNAYHCPALPVPGQIIRGSCTGSPPCPLGVECALEALRKLELTKGGPGAAHNYNEAAFDAAMDHVRTRVSRAMKLPSGCGVFLSASGTDVEFIPLVIAQQLYPDAPIKSVLVADNETGSGGANACCGRIFDKRVPLAGAEEVITRVRAEDRKVGETLMGLPDVEQLRIPARHDDGSITDVVQALSSSSFCSGEAAKKPVWILRQVLGSKTGFSTTKLPVRAFERVIEVADFCQMRKGFEEMREVLGRGACLLVTGSKFFQGSIFSAATIVPPHLMSRLSTSSQRFFQDPPTPPLPAGLRDYFAYYDVPRELPHWRMQLGSTINPGLLLRWHTALPLLEGVSALPAGRREVIDKEWSARVAGLLNGVTGADVAHTEGGIVSFTVAKADGTRCNKDELKVVHKWLANDASSLATDVAIDQQQQKLLATRCFIGQPVVFTREYAVLRLAIGAECVLAIAHRTYDFDTSDAVIVRKLCLLLQLLNGKL